MEFDSWKCCSLTGKNGNDPTFLLLYGTPDLWYMQFAIYL